MSRRALDVPGGTGWDRVFRHFVLGGGAAAIGPDATACLIAIQALVDINSGIAEVSRARLAQLTGVSTRGVARALDVLKAAEFLHLEPAGIGKKCRYRVRRWMSMTQPSGETADVAWFYSPRDEHAKVAAVTRLTETGDFQSAAGLTGLTVHIHVNQLQIVQPGGVGVQVAAADAAEAASEWWRRLSPDQWNGALSAAGLSGTAINLNAKIEAWKAAGSPRA